MDPDLQELYRLERENNRMLRSLKRRSLWGGIFRIILFIIALGIPVWLYFTYLAPIFEQMNAMLESATGTRVQIQGQFEDWASLFKEYFGTGTTSSSTPR